MKTLVKRSELASMVKRRELASKVPEPLKVFNMATLVALCKYHARGLYGNTSEDDRQYIYEEAMKAIYGPDFWVNLDKALRDRQG